MNFSSLPLVIRNSSLNGSYAFNRPSVNTTLFGWLCVLQTTFSIIFNAFFITVYGKTPTLHMPFSVYLVGLAIADFLRSSVTNFATISNYLQIPWIFGERFCIACLYLANVLTGLTLHIHILIGGNRFWAVTFPNSYRLYHTNRFAVWATVATVIYLNVLSSPGLIVFANKPQPGAEQFCMYSLSGPGQQLYFQFIAVFTHFLPQIVVIVLYIFTSYKVYKIRRKRMRVRNKGHRTITGTGSIKMSSEVRSQQTAVSSTNASLEYEAKRLQPRSHQMSCTNGGEPATATENGTGSKSQGQEKRKEKSDSRHFVMLSVLFISVTALWTPSHVAFVMLIWTSRADFRLLAIGNFLFGLDCTINPVLCMISSKEWRNAAGVLFRGSR